MKKALLGLLLLASIVVNAQKKTINYVKKDIGNISLQYDKGIDLDRNDTLYMVFVIFQNAKYKSIIDTKVIGFFKNADLSQFKKDLTNAYKQLLTNEKVDIQWDREKYRLNLYNFSNYLYLSEGRKDGDAYTMISKKQVLELLEELSTIEFGKETLLPIANIN